MKRFRKSAIALVLALLMALQGTEPIFVQAKEAIEDVQKNADFSRPEALTEEEAGITDSTSGEQDKSQQSDADVQNETTPSEDTETQEEQTTPAEETEENPQEKEVELKEPQDYYPIPEEPEGELIDYDAISKTYKTGDKQYTTVYGGYVGTYKNEDGDTELVDNTLVKPEEADTPASEEAQEASSVVATEEKEEKTEVYQNKANDYAILLPEQMSEENGVTIENGKTRIGIIPVDGDYTHSVIKDNAILYNEVYEGADVQYTVLDSSIKEDIVLQQPTDREVYEYELQIPGYQAEVKDNQVYIYPEGKTIKDAKYLLETPSMEDAAGEISFLITLELREEDGKTILTVKPDRDWLSAEERQYPVRIDPTPVEIQKSSFNMIGVEEGSPTSQIGDNNYPYVGFDDGIKSGNLAGFGTAHQNCRTYIKVNSNFSQIPKDSKIDSATFAVSQKTAYSGGASQFGLYRVDQSWNTSITWKTKPVTALVPAMVTVCMEMLEWDEDYDISSLRILQVGGAMLEDSLADKIIEEWPCKLMQVFGTAEGLLSFTSPEDEGSLIARCQGTPVSPADEVKIVDEEDKAVPEGVFGELLSRGPYTIDGYYMAEEANKKSFTSDGFYRTGDKAMWTKDRRLRLGGRIKEQINRAGEKIMPSEIEAYLCRHSKIKEVAVVGVPDETLGNRICAFLVTDDEAGIDLQEIHRFLREIGVAAYKMPDQIERVETWPLTSVGKIDKKALERMAQEK